MVDNPEQVKLLMDTLISDPVKQINFTMDGMKIDRSGFMLVFNALKSGRITVGVGNIPAGAGADYEFNGNVFDLPRLNYGVALAEKMVIVHESVHAIQDIRSKPFDVTPQTTATTSGNEAVAYVAAALFIRYALDAPIDKENPSRATKDVFLKADEIARKVMKSHDGVVSDEDTVALRRVVVADEAYSSRKVTFEQPSYMDGVAAKK